jgi:hypothetical protein
MNKSVLKYFLPAILLFVFFNSGLLVMKKNLESWGFNYSVLLFGNLLIFAICFLSFWMGAKGLATKNSHAFFRWVYSSIMIKLFVLAAAAFIYIITMKKEVNKPGIIFCMGLYIIYTFIEVSGLMKVNKQKSNA